MSEVVFPKLLSYLSNLGVREKLPEVGDVVVLAHPVQGSHWPPESKGPEHLVDRDVWVPEEEPETFRVEERAALGLEVLQGG